MIYEVNAPRHRQVVQFFDAVNDFLRGASGGALQRLIEGMDLVKSIAYAEEPIADLRQRLNLGFLVFLRHELTLLEMAGLSCCELGYEIDRSHLSTKLSVFYRSFVLVEFLRFSEKELKVCDPLNLFISDSFHQKGFRAVIAPEFFSFLGRYCGKISKAGTHRTVALGTFFDDDGRPLTGYMPEGSSSDRVLGAFWENSKLKVELIRVKDLRPGDTFLVVRTGQDSSQ